MRMQDDPAAAYDPGPAVAVAWRGNLSAHWRRLCGLGFVVLLGLQAGVANAQKLGGGSVDLARQRAARREAIRQASARAAAESLAATFALLVIPVDFADARLPADWEPGNVLGPRLFPLSGETLAHYFQIASRGRFALRPLLAPLVRLPGARLDYSDVGLGGLLVRSRRLAREALEGARDLGVDFRLLDDDGPDRQPATADDDGFVDGVLLLHSGPGDENDPQGGLIQALQFFLEEPVTSGGIAAASYAVASQQSGVGIWAHETAHLLGLEDRYDTFLAVTGSDAAGRGGLGRFSLMAAGAFGIGGGHGAAMLDAFSAAQLGWCDVRTVGRGEASADTLRRVLQGGEVWRVWTHGRREPEYFLLESRGGPEAGPFDAGVPPDQLLIYHVDESLPERQQSSPNPPRHIRVALVEADGDGRLAAGLDAGGLEDLFPGSLEATEFTPASQPASDGYGGPSEVFLTGITSIAGGVVLGVDDATTHEVQLDFSFTSEAVPRLSLTARSVGSPLSALNAVIHATGDPPWGRFADGSLTAHVALQGDGAGAWTLAAPVFWNADPSLPEGAATLFVIGLEGDGWQSIPQQRSWLWRDLIDPLDFAAGWPGQWQTFHPTGDQGTTWHLWQGASAWTTDGSPLLACTGATYVEPAGGDEVSYTNNADVVLQSPPLPRTARAVRIVHAVAAELVRPAVAWDAGAIELGLPDGSWQEAAPLDGYGGRVEDAARCALHGREAFAAEDSLGAAGPLAWRIDLIPIPELPQPIRLRLHFASDPLYRGAGWFVARLDVVNDALPEAAFPVALRSGDEGAAAGIAWAWPWREAPTFAVESSLDLGAAWQQAWRGLPEALPEDLPWFVALDDLQLGSEGSASRRILLRVVAEVSFGRVASRPLVLQLGGTAPPPLLLGSPYPNPSRGDVHCLVDLPDKAQSRLRLYDLRGRCLRSWDLTGGRQLLVWDGKDSDGKRAAAGIYVFRLETMGLQLSQKVVQLH